MKSFTRGIIHKSNPIYISISPVHTHACLYTLIQRMDAWVRQPALEAGSSSVVTCVWVSPGKSRRAGICFIPPVPQQPRGDTHGRAHPCPRLQEGSGPGLGWEAETVPRQNDCPRPLANRSPPNPSPPGFSGRCKLCSARSSRSYSGFLSPLLPRGRPVLGLSASVLDTLSPPRTLLSQPHFAPNARSPAELISTAT